MDTFSEYSLKFLKFLVQTIDGIFVFSSSAGFSLTPKAQWSLWFDHWWFFNTSAVSYKTPRRGRQSVVHLPAP